MSPARMSRIELAPRLVLEFNKAFNHHDVAAMMKLMSDDCVFETTGPAPDGTVVSGRDAIFQYLQEFFIRSPHAHIEIEEIVGMGYRCVMRWKYTWEDSTGKKGHLRGVDIFQVKDDLISERFSYDKGQDVT